MKVLYLLSHAPEYREAFLRQLAARCDLTVFAKPCDPDGLIPPEGRGPYRYVEGQSLAVLRQLGLEVIRSERRLIGSGDWDAVCAGWNLHHVARLFGWVNRRSVAKRWIWAGMFYGRRDGKLMRQLRRTILNASDGVLAYSQDVANRLERDGVVAPIASFNNTNLERSGFDPLPIPEVHGTLNIICVGRYQPRKRLERLVALALRNPRVNVRLVGPGMVEALSSGKDVRGANNLEVYGPATGNRLREHMAWSHLVAMPGAMGLVAMTAAQFRRPIVFGSGEPHGPEAALARGANQPEIDWSDPHIVDSLISRLIERPTDIACMADVLHQRAKRYYTVEHMVDVFCDMLGVGSETSAGYCRE